MRKFLLRTSSHRRGSLDLKRLMDVSLAAAAIVVAGPLMVVIGVAVRLESDGPAIFRQERVGRYGKVFHIHKFRSMRVDAIGPPLSRTLDPRVTRVGAILRSTKLDELPQFVDVLIGRMSLVGPRPELAEYVALWPPEARDAVLSVRPGITDPASIEFRNEADELEAAVDWERHYTESLLPRKVGIYMDYVRSQSMHGDLLILGKTLLTVIRD